jgi:hypothetical protein
LCTWFVVRCHVCCCAGTGRTGFIPVGPNNYPFYRSDETYKPVLQSDGGQLSGKHAHAHSMSCSLSRQHVHICAMDAVLAICRGGVWSHPVRATPAASFQSYQACDGSGMQLLCVRMPAALMRQHGDAHIRVLCNLSSHES